MSGPRFPKATFLHRNKPEKKLIVLPNTSQSALFKQSGSFEEIVAIRENEATSRSAIEIEYGPGSKTWEDRTGVGRFYRLSRYLRDIFFFFSGDTSQFT